jgi:hypothetical protein
MKRDHRYLLLAVALMLLPLVGITAAEWPKIFPLFDPPMIRRPIIQKCVPGQPCYPPPSSRLVPIPDPWTSTPSAPCKPGEKCPGHPIRRRPLVPVEPVKQVEPPATYAPSVSVSVGTVLTVGPDEPASVVIQETAPGRYLLNFCIPRGKDGRDDDRGGQGQAGSATTINIAALAKMVSPLIEPFVFRTLDADGNELGRQVIGPGEVLNFHHNPVTP